MREKENKEKANIPVESRVATDCTGKKRREQAPQKRGGTKTEVKKNHASCMPSREPAGR